jgi:hypothetical protein
MIRTIMSRSPRPSWRLSEGRVVRPELWLAATVVVGMLLVEVWQNSRMAELCLALEQNRTALARANARMDFVRAGFERRTTRAELAPLASELGLAPADAQQVVTVPSEYLADGGSGSGERGSPSLLALAERASRALVPDARAKSRSEN